MEKNDVVSKLRPVIEDIVKSCSLNLYDLEYVKEDGNYFLRVSIEKDDGTMDFETAEVVSDIVSKKLDELDPIEHSYILEVCSPGAERPLKNKEDFVKYLGNYITVELKDLDENKKNSYTGDLVSFEENVVTISYKDKTRTKQVKINYSDIASAHLAIKF